MVGHAIRVRNVLFPEKVVTFIAEENSWWPLSNGLILAWKIATLPTIMANWLQWVGCDELSPSIPPMLNTIDQVCQTGSPWDGYIMRRPCPTGLCKGRKYHDMSLSSPWHDWDWHPCYRYSPYVDIILSPGIIEHQKWFMHYVLMTT